MFPTVGRVLVVLSLFLAAAPARAEAPCEDCWNDSCKQFKGVLPRCAAGGGSRAPTPKGPSQPAQPMTKACTTVTMCNAQCSSGDMGACVALGSMFENGFGVAADRARAEQWYDFACKAGYAQGCVRLKPFEAERAARAAEERKAAADAVRREKEAEAERKRQEALVKEQQRQAEFDRQRADAERKRQEEADARARAEREKKKRVEWVAVGPLRVAKTEATVLQFDTCVAEQGCQKQKACGQARLLKEDAPATCLDWKQATAFCAWAGGRLPMGVEWLALATNGGTTKYPWGDDAPNAKRAIYNAAAPVPVGSVPMGGSKAGLLDLVGSVWEWTSDDAPGGKKEVRGGSWDYLEANLNPEARPAYAANVRFDGVGVRCVRAEVGDVTIEAEPAGALVLVDGIPLASLPWKGALEPGQHRVTVKADTYLLSEQRITVKKGAPLVTKVALKKDPQYVPARLVISGVPEGAGISVDGKPVGLLPWEGDVAQGAHTVELSLEGYESTSKQVTAKGGATRKLEISLKKEPLKPVTQTVRLQSEPPGAAVLDGKKTLGTTPLEVDLLSGAHELTWTLKGYETQKLKLEVPTASPLTMVKLEPTPVAVSVRSSPLGATLVIDGAAVGKTPWSGKLAPGEHQVGVELAGYESFAGTLQAPGKLAPSLKPLPTGLRTVVSPAPPGLQYRVDGKPLEAVAGLLEVSAGTRVLSVSAPGFKTAQATVKVVARQISAVEVQLVEGYDLPSRGLFVNSTPPGAEVTLDEVKVGTTPWSNAELAPGPHKVSVSRAGYEVAAATVEVQKGKLTEHQVTLAALPVLVAIESVPQGAKIFVDGEAQGQTPNLVKLPVGSHRFYLVLDGHEPSDEQKLVEAGATPQWSWTLKSLAPVAAVVPVSGVAGLTPEEALRRIVGDNAQSVEVKREKFAEFAKTASDVSYALQAVTPPSLRDELCVEWATKARPFRYVARAVDSFSDEARGELMVNGRVQGPLPFDGPVPACATRFEVRSADGTVVGRPGGGVPGEGGAPDIYSVPGRRTRFVLSAFGEGLLAPFRYAIVTSPGDLAQVNPGAGLRWDVWGKWIHFSLAAKAGTVLRQTLFWGNVAGQVCDEDPDGNFQCVPPVMPQADLFLGFTLAAGSEAVRYRVALDVGVWSLINPAVRLTNALSFGERFFLTLTLDTSYLVALYGSIPFGTEENQVLLLGGSFALGVGW